MKAVAKLKDEARKFEQSEQWESAIQAYIEVLRITDNAESELPLYNRVGDLYVRMGRPLDAVTYYEQAADHYAEAGLYNNAIALCNKALRYVPNRLELLRKLGQFSAAQGFLLDARRWYLEYAERQLKNGALDDAFTALEDFATVYDDAEIRELLGRQLLAHNRLGPAVIALKRAHALRLDAGEQAAADALKAEIQKLAPDAFLGDKVEPRAARVAPPPPAAPLPPAPRRSNDLPGFSDFDFEAGAGPGYAPPPPAMPTPPPAPVEPEIEQSFLGEAEDAELGFDEQLANLALDRALDPGVEAPVENSHAAEPPAQRIEAPIGSTPQDTVDPGKDDQDFPEDADDLPLMDDLLPEPGVGFTLDLPPLVEAFDLDQSQPLPFLSFGETGSTMGQDETDDPLPRLDFDKIVPGLRPTLTDLPEFETTEPLQPIDLDAAFASMSSPPPPLPATPPTPVPAEPDSWTEVPEWESSAEIEYGSDPTVRGERAEETIDAQDWVRPTDLEFTHPPLEPLTSRPAPAPIEPPAPAAPFVEPISTTPPIPEPLVASPGTKFDRAPAMAPQPTEEDLDPPVGEPFVSTTEPLPVYTPEPEPESEPEPEPEPELAFLEPEPKKAPAAVARVTRPEPAAPPRPEKAATRPARGAEDLAALEERILVGDSAGAAHRLEELHVQMAAQGKHREAWQACELLLQINPGNLKALQQRVEYASSLGQRDLLLRSYLELARRLRDNGSSAKSAVIYQRVLDIDPYNEEAQTAAHGAQQPETQTGYVDLFALIADEDESETSTRFQVEEKVPTGDEERDFADMLSQFKHKVAENISLHETGAHYDLGLAFKEMGLFDEAIAEFQTAMKGGGERLKLYEELGQCFLLKQQYNVAVNVLNRALQLPIQDARDLVGVYYTLALAHEELGQVTHAREAYEHVIGLDINFQDASQRLAKL